MLRRRSDVCILEDEVPSVAEVRHIVSEEHLPANDLKILRQMAQLYCHRGMFGIVKCLLAKGSGPYEISLVVKTDRFCVSISVTRLMSSMTRRTCWLFQIALFERLDHGPFLDLSNVLSASCLCSAGMLLITFLETP